MVTNSFNLKFLEVTKTPDGEINFIGVVTKFFDAIFKNANDETKDAYIANYNDNIFPYVNISMSIFEYNDQIALDLIYRIQKYNNYKDTTVLSRIHNLIFAPLVFYSKNNKKTNFMWGSSSSFNHFVDGVDDKYAAETKIKKSLSITEEKKAYKLLSDSKTESGERIGLLIMLLVGIRNNETCGLNFGDLLEMLYYPGCFYLQVYETTSLTSNELKASGKTYNSPRRLPALPILVKLIFERKKYIEEQISFPYKSKDGAIYEKIEDMPIACKGNDFGRRCFYKDLTEAGKEFLRKELRMNENTVAGLSECMIQDYGTDDYLDEKDVTTYLLRRNFATHLYTLGLSIEQSQYYMGHKIENSPLKRADFTDEDFLYEIYELLIKHPLNNFEDKQIDFNGGLLELKNKNTTKIIISKENTPCSVSIKTREFNDQTKIIIKGSKDKIEITNKPISHLIPKNNNIIKQIMNAYNKKK